MNGIEEKMLKILISTSPKTFFAIKAIEGGFCLLIRTPVDEVGASETEYTEFVLNRTQGTGARVWKSLDSIYHYISTFTPEWSHIEIIR